MILLLEILTTAPISTAKPDQPPSTLPDLIKIYGNERRAIESDPSLACVNKIFESEIAGLQI
jgi:hypothetical protein